MSIKRRTDITIETHSVTIVHVSQRQTATAFCERCHETLGHFSVARAAAILQLTEMAIFRVVENGELHATENAAGSLLVCGNSLSVLAKELRGRNG